MPAKDSLEAYLPPSTRGRFKPNTKIALAAQMAFSSFKKQFSPVYFLLSSMAFPQDSLFTFIQSCPVLPSQHSTPNFEKF
jgi:hypothetical protein